MHVIKDRLLIISIILFVSLSLEIQNVCASTTYSVVGVGDIVLGLNYPEDNKRLPANGGRDLLKRVKPFLKSADVTVGNLEGVFLDSGGEPKKVNEERFKYLFRMPTSYCGLLTDAGFDFLSIANNHIKDFGQDGMDTTRHTLRSHGLKYSGIKGVCETAILERDSVRYGFCAFSPNAFMLSVFDYGYAARLVRELKSKCDIVIVSMHIGAEGKTKYRVPKVMEEYAGEKRGNAYKFAHCVVDAGADIVFGHGPHVVRGMELYKGRFIAYSLGNFCTPFGVNKMGKCGYSPAVKVEVDKQGAFVTGEILSARQLGWGGPIPDKEKLVIKEIRTLNKLDFPNNRLKIYPSGRMCVR